MCLLPESISYGTARDCFSSLWKPAGRGSVHNLALIAWIDANAWLDLGHLALREWSQLKSAYDIQEVYMGLKSGPLEIFISTLEQVLASGMRLATLKGSQLLGMVHPNAQVGDNIYLLRGCAIPAVLRAMEGADEGKRYHVIGGGYTIWQDQSYYDRYWPGAKVPPTDWDSDVAVMTLC